MNSIETKSDEFLRELYKESGGNSSEAKDMYDIGRKLGLDQSSTKKIAQHLKDKGWIMYVSAGPLDSGILVSITQPGIDKVKGTS